MWPVLDEVRQIEQMRLYTHVSYLIMQPVRIAGLYSGVYDYFNTTVALGKG
jgi:hypothetical protein